MHFLLFHTLSSLHSSLRSRIFACGELRDPASFACAHSGLAKLRFARFSPTVLSANPRLLGFTALLHGELPFLTGTVHFSRYFLRKLENISKSLAALHVFAPHPDPLPKPVEKQFCKNLPKSLFHWLKNGSIDTLPYFENNGEDVFNGSTVLIKGLIYRAI